MTEEKKKDVPLVEQIKRYLAYPEHMYSVIADPGRETAYEIAERTGKPIDEVEKELEEEELLNKIDEARANRQRRLLKLRRKPEKKKEEEKKEQKKKETELLPEERSEKSKPSVPTSGAM